jgi:hypothetical protein
MHQADPVKDRLARSRRKNSGRETQ